jgi:hypothetical protein
MDRRSHGPGPAHAGPPTPWARGDRVAAARLYGWVTALPELAGLEPEARDAAAAAATLEAARGRSFQDRWLVAILCLGLGPCAVGAAFIAAWQGALDMRVAQGLLGGLVLVFVSTSLAMRAHTRRAARRLVRASHRDASGSDEPSPGRAALRRAENLAFSSGAVPARWRRAPETPRPQVPGADTRQDMEESAAVNRPRE